MTLAYLALVALGILANIVTFTVGVMVGLVKRKEADDRRNFDNKKDPSWWHSPQVQRR